MVNSFKWLSRTILEMGDSVSTLLQLSLETYNGSKFLLLRRETIYFLSRYIVYVSDARFRATIPSPTLHFCAVPRLSRFASLWMNSRTDQIEIYVLLNFNLVNSW